MADQLADPDDVASLLELTDPDAGKLAILVEAATAVVQAAAGGQRILQVADDELSVMGLPHPWLDLPQIPVTSVSAVTIDGSAVTDFKLVGDRLWRRCGWVSPGCWDPSVVAVTCTHGYPPDDQGLQLARSAVLSLCTSAYKNPAGLAAEKLDDYSVTYAAMSAQMETTPHIRYVLRRQYGRRAGAIRLGH